MTTPVESVHRDVLVIGGGPAGLAAALAASQAGAQVTLVDEQPLLGGQIYRQPSPSSKVATDTWDMARSRAGHRLIAAVMDSPVDVLTDAVVWAIWGREAFICRNDSEVRRIVAGAIIIASGAYDRPLPFPGWTLPGVFTAGGAQVLVKNFRVTPGRRILMAGSGPLSLAFAAELRRRGANVIMLTEACCRPGGASVLGLLRASPGNTSSILDGVNYLRYLRGERIPVRWSTMIRRAEGDGKVERAVIVKVERDWRPIAGSEEVLDVDAICLGYGLFPSNELTRLCGCSHEYHEQRGGWVPRRDKWMRSSMPGILVAGDCAGISGSAAALEEGRVAGWASAVDTGHLSAERAAALAKPAHAALRRSHRLRAALDQMYPVGPGVYDLASDDTTICRCEEVTLSEIKTALETCPLDTQGVRTSTRAGMGLCQGRICGRQIAAEVARASHAPIGSVAPLSIRSPIKPVPIAAVAAEMPERVRPIVEPGP